LFLFVILVIFQLVPLSAGLLKVISPATFALYRDFRPGPNEFLTLSIYPDATINLLLQLLSFLAVFFVALNYIDDEKKGKRVIFAIILSGFLYALFGLIRRFTVPFGGFSTFTNRNHFAAYMEMIIPLGVAFVLIEKEKTKKAILIFLTSVMGLALLLSLSRGGIICFSLSLLLALVLLKLKHSLKKGLIVFVFLGFLLSLFLAAIGVGSITKRLETLQNPLKAMTGRVEVLKDAPRIASDFPVFGTGLGTFIDIFPKYQTFESKTYRFAHNEPLQLIVESGILGFLLFFTFLLFYCKDILKLWLKRRNPFAVYNTLGCLIGLISVTLHSLFEFMFHVPAVSLLFFLLLALMFRTVYMKEQQQVLPVPQFGFMLSKSLRPVLFGTFLLVFLLVELFIINRYQAESVYIKAVKIRMPSLIGEEASIERNRALRLVDRAVSLNPRNSNVIALKAGLLEDIDLYKAAINLNASKAEYHLRLGLIYEKRNMLYEAQKEFQKAFELNPKNSKKQ
jgi:O-antigen ligase